MKELHIRLSEPTVGAYQAEIVPPPACAERVDPPAGAGWPCQLQLPAPLPGSGLTLADFQGYLLDLEQGTSANELEAIGIYLYDFLFGPPHNRNVLYEYWDKCFHESLEIQVHGMRTVLQLDSPSLIGVPWELCNDEGNYLAVQTPHTLVRTAWQARGAFRKEPVSLPGPNSREPLRVLLIISHEPTDMQVKGLEEALNVDAALFRLLPWMVDLHILIRPTIAEMREWCEDWEPHVFHYVGHGGATAEGRPYLLIYEEGQAEATPIYQDAMINFFRRRVPRLVVLNACRSGQAGGADMSLTAARTTQSFSERLIQQGVLAVIAMQADIQGADAVALMHKFYEELAQGKVIDDALTLARDHRFSQAGMSTAKWDWALPAFYLAKGVCAEEVICLDGAEADPKIFPGMVNNHGQLPLPMSVKIQVGREKEQLKLAKTVLAPDLAAIPPITLLYGVEDIGKTTMLYWLSERCARLGRPFIYSDFARTPLNYWDVLRLIRDGRLATKVNGVALNNHLHLNSNVIFNTFNDALNRKSVANYALARPQKPEDATPVEDEEPEKDPTSGMAQQGMVRSDENPFETITSEFWNGLARIAKSNGLIIFLDHIEKLSPATIETMRKYLVEHILNARDYPAAQKVHLVLAIREVDPDDEPALGRSDLDTAWNFLFELVQKDDPRVRKLRFEKFSPEQLRWLARVWARRYFILCSGASSIKTGLEILLNRPGSNPERVYNYVDEYVERRIMSYGPAPLSKTPGLLIDDLLNKTYVKDWSNWLKLQTSESPR
jgi:CHAT domain